ncbi:hypothetical protein QQS21_009528 [Conoideocrella luteorostrata]|uniref:Neutral protease 2 n=1 Tax=Conoideocrella luteorostrata TaxID=1105319 RepID=A0AAJ0FXQ4_9HYPO|nr:hypothetical protein QQS21_009528 [Conoideocrella luteorostrata]
MRRALLIVALALGGADACGSCRARGTGRRSANLNVVSNNDSGNNSNNNINNNTIPAHPDGILGRLRCGLVPASATTDASKRAAIENDCGQNHQGGAEAIQEALRTCVTYANAGAEETSSGSSGLFELFFKEENVGQKSYVAEQFRAIAEECQAEESGGISITCTDGQIEACGTDIVAWAKKAQAGARGDRVQLCPPFFDGLPNGCGNLDQPGVIVHEFSHAVVGTDDIGYGMGAVLGNSYEQNLNHADTWALFAQAASLRCSPEDLRAGAGAGGSGGGGGGGGSAGQGQQLPQGEVPRPQGEVPRPQGEVPRPQGEVPRPQGEVPRPQGEVPRPQGGGFEAPQPQGGGIEVPQQQFPEGGGGIEVPQPELPQGGGIEIPQQQFPEGGGGFEVPQPQLPQTGGGFEGAGLGDVGFFRRDSPQPQDGEGNQQPLPSGLEFPPPMSTSNKLRVGGVPLLQPVVPGSGRQPGKLRLLPRG